MMLTLTRPATASLARSSSPPRPVAVARIGANLPGSVAGMATDWAGMASAYDASFARLCEGTIPFIVEAAGGVPRRRRVADGEGAATYDGKGAATPDDKGAAAPDGEGAATSDGGTGGAGVLDTGTAAALDVGTGTGTVAAALGAAGFDAIGVDADDGMVDFASKAHPGLTFLVGALPGLPFQGGEFDVVAANFVVNHTLRPRLAVRELARVAKHGGLVIATIWPSSPVSPLNQLWNDVMRDSRAVPLTGTRLPPEDDFERSASGFGALFSDARLADVRVEEVSWDFVISPGDLWVAVEAGIATIGANYRHQSEAGRQAMRAAYEDLTKGGGLTLPSTALIAVGRAV